MAKAQSGAVAIEYETFGERTNEAVLLINGLGSQMTRWPETFCALLVDKGLFPIRFDNRDVGLSTWLKEGDKYTAADMAADAAAMLDAVGKAKAHIVGVSMGGMIAQEFAAAYPQRTLSLTSIMSNTGNPELPQATPEAMAVLTRRAPSPLEDEAGFLDHSVASQKVTGSPAYPFDEADLRIQLLADAKRAYYPAGFTRQMAAITATGDRRALLKTITAPTLVVHGAEDPLVPLPGGEDTALNIPGAELIILPGVGHDLPTALDDMLADAIARNAQKARATA